MVYYILVFEERYTLHNPSATYFIFRYTESKPSHFLIYCFFFFFSTSRTEAVVVLGRRLCLGGMAKLVATLVAAGVTGGPGGATIPSRISALALLFSSRSLVSAYNNTITMVINTSVIDLLNSYLKCQKKVAQ